MRNIKILGLNLLIISSLIIVFSGCSASINYKPHTWSTNSEADFVAKHKAINGDDLKSQIITTSTYEDYLSLSKEKALSYAYSNGTIYLGISESNENSEIAKINSLKICKNFSSKECKLHSINNRIISTK